MGLLGAMVAGGVSGGADQYIKDEDARIKDVRDQNLERIKQDNRYKLANYNKDARVEETTAQNKYKSEESALDRASAERRTALTAGAKGTKAPTAAELKLKEKNARANMLGAVSSIGGEFDEDSQELRIPLGKDGKPLISVDEMSKRTGFQIYPVKDGEGTKGGFLSFGGDKYHSYMIGGYNGVAAPPDSFAKEKKVTPPGEKKEEKVRAGISTFDGETKEVPPKGVTEVPPKEVPPEVPTKTAAEAKADIEKVDKNVDINKALPADPTKWAVQKRLYNGKYVQSAKVNGKIIPLTKEELKFFYQVDKGKRKGLLKDFFADDPTGIKKLRKEYADKQTKE